ncbi:MAG: hypothetical protein AABY22_17710, partial [Nanoarchaeota archaeon]
IKELQKIIAENKIIHSKELENINYIYVEACGEIASLDREVKSRREQIADINQWSHILLMSSDLRPRVMKSMFMDINNRTTD